MKWFFIVSLTECWQYRDMIKYHFIFCSQKLLRTIYWPFMILRLACWAKAFSRRHSKMVFLILLRRQSTHYRNYGNWKQIYKNALFIYFVIFFFSLLVLLLLLLVVVVVVVVVVVFDGFSIYLYKSQEYILTALYSYYILSSYKMFSINM